MSWNYRIIDHGDHLALHEVHDDADGKPNAYTARPVTFVSGPGEGSEISSALALAADGALKPAIPVAVFDREVW